MARSWDTGSWRRAWVTSVPCPFAKFGIECRERVGNWVERTVFASRAEDTSHRNKKESGRCDRVGVWGAVING